MATRVPAECFYVRFGSFGNFLWFQDTLAKWRGDLGNLMLTFPGLAPSQLESESGKRFFQGFIDKHGVEPTPWSTYAYQSMQVILNSIERAGTNDRTAILDAMASGNYNGITGDFGFNENGDPTLAFLGGNEVKDGAIEFAGAISPDMHESCP